MCVSFDFGVFQRLVDRCGLYREPLAVGGSHVCLRAVTVLAPKRFRAHTRARALIASAAEPDAVDCDEFPAAAYQAILPCHVTCCDCVASIMSGAIVGIACCARAISTGSSRLAAQKQIAASSITRRADCLKLSDAKLFLTTPFWRQNRAANVQSSNPASGDRSESGKALYQQLGGNDFGAKSGRNRQVVCEVVCESHSHDENCYFCSSEPADWLLTLDED